MSDLLTPPANARIIRVSERQTWEKCRRAWSLQYGEGLERLNPPTDARAFGTAVHAALHAFYKTQVYTESSMYEKWLGVCSDIDEEFLPLGDAMLQGYVRHYKNEDIEPIHIEQTFYAQVPGTDVWLQGTPDLVCKYNGSYAIIDHKTYTRMMDLFTLSHDDQMTAYLWLLRQNGLYCTQLVYNMLKKHKPTKPALLKAGTLSKDKSINTDVYTYTQEIKKYNFDINDYLDILEIIGEKEEFFRREIITRSMAAIDSFEEKLVMQVKEMTNPNALIYANDSLRHCGFCDYEKICTMMTNKIAKSTINMEKQHKFTINLRQVQEINDDE